MALFPESSLRHLGRRSKMWAPVFILVCFVSVLLPWLGSMPAQGEMSASGNESGLVSGRSGQATAVSVLAKDDVWVAGYRLHHDAYQGVLRHWDGHRWEVLAIPPKLGTSFLFTVSAISDENVWVGGTGGDNIPVIDHWNGSTWSSLSLPDASGYVSSLSAAGGQDIWAVGELTNHIGFIEHWDGTSWVHVDDPSQDPRRPSAPLPLPTHGPSDTQSGNARR